MVAASLTQARVDDLSCDSWGARVQMVGVVGFARRGTACIAPSVASWSGGVRRGESREQLEYEVLFGL